MRTLLRKLIDDLAASLGHLADARRPTVAMAVMVIGLVVTWFIYVPVHELLHVLGCVASGGSVSELQVAPQYGGALLARWFPFVVSGGDYAGRLSGFDTKGSDLIYLATDFAPYLLTVFLGVPILRACTRRRRPALLGAGVVVGLAPLYNVVGDYFEMGSIITTRAATLLSGSSESVAFAGIRSDDVFKLVGQLCTQPGELALHSPTAIGVAAVLILVSLLVGVVLAILTYALGDRFAMVFFGRSARRPT